MKVACLVKFEYEEWFRMGVLERHQRDTISPKELTIVDFYLL